MQSKTITVLAAAGMLFSSIDATAQSAYEGEPVQVTATRTEKAVDDSLAAVSVITQDEIARSQAPDLLELLRLEAGIDIARSGGPGGQTSVFMRGTNSNHMLVLVDGVRVAAAGAGAFTWEILDPSIIERIEIVRGPRAARWGSDAIGGVIQIFTRLPDGGAARAAYGRYDDRQLSAHFGNGFLGLNVAGRSVEGFSSQNPQGFAYDPDDDGFNNLSVSARGDYRLGDGDLSWSARLADGDVEFDQGESDFLNYAFRGSYSKNTDGPWAWNASAAFYRDNLETDNGFSISDAATRRIQTGFQAEREIGSSTTWLLGADAWHVEGDTSASFDEDRENVGIWTGLDGARGVFSWEASLRGDHDSQFGSALTGNLAGGWRVSETLRLSASLGRAFRAPSFSQLYAPGFSGQFAGNPELDPETSLSGELGLDWFGPGGHGLGLSVYQNEVEDLVAFSGPDLQAINIEKARIRGAELSYRFTSEHWRAESNLTWQDAENRTQNSDLLRRADIKGSVSLDRTFGNGGWLGAEIVHVGERPDFGVELASYTLVNLRAGWPLGAGLTLEGRLENLTDEDYEPLAGFNAHRRAAFVALRWQSP
ncbi:TonB-dependent receptor domain-containing protein [Wenzhouxiangella sp. EGI_FJ10305]|uniref:TonB-dependent receptor domain-containing protein n=1 Tax=Wenzhouxiangella sp. EGI_FJ10305 TaxID=3243768 RepID=UPI0035D8345C